MKERLKHGIGLAERLIGDRLGQRWCPRQPHLRAIAERDEVLDSRTSGRVAAEAKEFHNDELVVVAHSQIHGFLAGTVVKRDAGDIDSGQDLVGVKVTRNDIVLLMGDDLIRSELGSLEFVGTVFINVDKDEVARLEEVLRSDVVGCGALGNDLLMSCGDDLADSADLSIERTHIVCRKGRGVHGKVGETAEVWRVQGAEGCGEWVDAMLRLVRLVDCREDDRDDTGSVPYV